ncbi:MAG: hypothetical protein ACWGOX_10915 [Desulforhopalus sp.]
MKGYFWTAVKTIMTAVLLSLTFSGCASLMDKTVPVDKRISLTRQEGGKGSFTSGKLTLLYNYRIAGDEMTINGTVSFPHRVDFLNVRLLFLDGAGQVMESRLVYTSGYRTQTIMEKGAQQFRHSLKVPPEASGFSFSYSSQERTGRK